MKKQLNSSLTKEKGMKRYYLLGLVLIVALSLQGCRTTIETTTGGLPEGKVILYGPTTGGLPGSVTDDPFLQAAEYGAGGDE